MGYICHHAIIVTGDMDSPRGIVPAHAKACEIFPVVSPILISEVNFYGTFLIAPDGSKEGWEDSNQGNERREKFIKLLRDQFFWLTWAEIKYGDENDDNRILQCDADIKEE